MSLRKSRVNAVVAVSHMNRAREFFEGRLGLMLGDGSLPGELLYKCGDSTELVVYLSPGHAGGSTATIAAWEVDDLDLEMDVLLSKGIVFEEYDEPGLKTDSRRVAELNGGRLAWFKDPDGNTFAISQEFPTSRSRMP